MANDNSTFKYYHYDPSLAAAAAFTMLFLVTSVIHIMQLIKFRAWYFMPLSVGGIMECIGYVGRIQSAKQTPNWTLGPFIIQALLILVAPALVSATIYMVLGRIILAIDGEKFSLIRKKWLTKLFVTTDILSFLVLSGGSGMLASGNASNATTAQNIILGGLFIQIIAFGFFIFVAVLFHKRMHTHPTYQSTLPNMPWQKHMKALYFASLLIMVRSVVRVVEYIQGNDGYILGHEVFLYVFDSTFMLIAVVVFNFVHPSHMLQEWKRSHIRQVSLEPL